MAELEIITFSVFYIICWLDWADKNKCQKKIFVLQNTHFQGTYKTFSRGEVEAIKSKQTNNMKLQKQDNNISLLLHCTRIIKVQVNHERLVHSLFSFSLSNEMSWDKMKINYISRFYYVLNTSSLFYIFTFIVCFFIFVFLYYFWVFVCVFTN